MYVTTMVFIVLKYFKQLIIICYNELSSAILYVSAAKRLQLAEGADDGQHVLAVHYF